MPRTGRGGARVGAPGEAYANRSDLNMATTPAAAPAEGRDFGAATADLSSQAAVPMGPPPEGSSPAAPLSPGAPGPLPGELTPLDAPTMRPDEPITAGVDIGPGPGSSILMTAPVNRGREVLTRAAEETQDPYIAEILKTLGG